MSRRLTTLAVIGTRPDAIKMAPLVRLLKADTARFSCILYSTSQHKQMLQQALDCFGLSPDIDLDVMRPDQSLCDLTTQVLLGLQGVLNKLCPDVVLVHGDTTTALAVALAAFYHHVSIAHIEAGLRTHDLAAPFPEEANRVIIDKLSQFLFCPTGGACSTLVAEGANPAQIYVTGNTVVDAVLWMVGNLAHSKFNPQDISPELNFTKKIILVTGHRRESFGEGFRHICSALRSIAAAHREVQVVYPVHLNPNVRGPVHEYLAGSNVLLLDPLPYDRFVLLMSRAHLILTDSGGIQEEAPSLHIPVLVMREKTERPEAIEAGTAVLVGTERDRIVEGFQRVYRDRAVYEAMRSVSNPFGDGQASKRIADILFGSTLCGHSPWRSCPRDTRTVLPGALSHYNTSPFALTKDI